MTHTEHGPKGRQCRADLVHTACHQHVPWSCAVTQRHMCVAEAQPQLLLVASSWHEHGSTSGDMAGTQHIIHHAIMSMACSQRLQSPAPLQASRVKHSVSSTQHLVAVLHRPHRRAPRRRSEAASAASGIPRPTCSLFNPFFQLQNQIIERNKKDQVSPLLSRSV